jgi:hypothetical protein
MFACLCGDGPAAFSGGKQMWKSILMVILAFPLSLLILIIFGIGESWKTGVMAGCVTLAICFIIAAAMLLFMKKFSLVDVFIPLAFSIVWSIVLIPLSFDTAVFTVPSAIGSGLILTLCLWRVYHNGGRGKGWLIIPIIVYIYEMLPVNIPGPFDDYFAFTGDAITAIIFYLSTSSMHQLPQGED